MCCTYFCALHLAVWVLLSLFLFFPNFFLHISRALIKEISLKWGEMLWRPGQTTLWCRNGFVVNAVVPPAWNRTEQSGSRTDMYFLASLPPPAAQTRPRCQCTRAWTREATRRERESRINAAIGLAPARPPGVDAVGVVGVYYLPRDPRLWPTHPDSLWWWMVLCFTCHPLTFFPWKMWISDRLPPPDLFTFLFLWTRIGTDAECTKSVNRNIGQNQQKIGTK